MNTPNIGVGGSPEKPIPQEPIPKPEVPRVEQPLPPITKEPEIEVQPVPPPNIETKETPSTQEAILEGVTKPISPELRKITIGDVGGSPLVTPEQASELHQRIFG